MSLAQRRLLPQLLRYLPRRLLALLDDWSYRIAQDRAKRRRRLSR